MPALLVIAEPLWGGRQRAGTGNQKEKGAELHLVSCLVFQDILPKKTKLMKVATAFRRGLNKCMYPSAGLHGADLKALKNTI